MSVYTMSPKKGKEPISKTTQHTTLKEAIKYFAEIKQLSVGKFNELFTVTKIKDDI